jgi:hypothetical protein
VLARRHAAVCAPRAAKRQERWPRLCRQTLRIVVGTAEQVLIVHRDVLHWQEAGVEATVLAGLCHV